jgi:hypothetical protein
MFLKAPPASTLATVKRKGAPGCAVFELISSTEVTFAVKQGGITGVAEGAGDGSGVEAGVGDATSAAAIKNANISVFPSVPWYRQTFPN